ncbi:MAG: flagellar biosynthetic protein FliQ [Planctomycetaceae bacterium]|nr:flagellar biosynthetic protein FliQ [Planctomycetaceae bacterium]
MDDQMVLYIGKRTLETALLVSTPVLLVALLVGVLTAIFQAVTSLRDMTLGTVLKLAAVGLTLLAAGGWMMQMATAFTLEIFQQAQALGR